MRSWTLIQRAAVLDAIERVWARHDQGDIDDLIAAAFRLDRGDDRSTNDAEAPGGGGTAR